jgi:DnaJ-domain-containing protein 1
MSGANPFEVLGVALRFDLSPAVLRAAWMRRAAVEHPDADGALDASTRVNDAFRTLSEPIGRATALLQARNAPSVDERELPVGFLMEMMDLRERADAAVEDHEAAVALREEATARRAEAITAIETLFGQAGTGTDLDRSVAQQIAVQINVVRSFDRMVEQLEREAKLP